MHLPIRMAVAFLLGQLAIANAADQAFHNPYGRLPMNATPGDRMIADYFQIETRKLRDNCLADVTTLDDWKRRRPVLRKQLFEMLGLTRHVVLAKDEHEALLNLSRYETAPIVH